VPSIGERLLEERERLGLSQPALADACRVTMRSQRNYEKNERFPDAAYLAAIAAAGADVRYVITGDREGPPPLALSPDEHVLLDGYRTLDKKTQKRMLAFVLGGDLLSEKKSKKITVTANGGQSAGRDIVSTTKTTKRGN